MKVLQVITSLQTGGAEKLLLEISPLLIKKGYSVDVLLLRNKNTPFRRQLEKVGIKVFSISETMNYYNPFFCIKLLPFMKGYDIIHVHLFPTLYWVALSNTLRVKKIPLIYTEHSTSNRRRKYKCLKWIEAIVYKQYQKIIAISEGAYKNLTAYMPVKLPLVIINNGIDVKSISEAEPLSLSFITGSVKHIIQVASFREQKDQDTVIKALSLLPDTYHVSFVGTGDRINICKSLAESLNLKDRVHFLSVRTDVPNILKSADIVVMSSHYEGFGLAAAEGMAAGKPVLATDVAGLREVVGDRDLLFKVGDYQMLAYKIRSLENPALYELKSQYCLNRAQQYDIQFMVDEYAKVYMSVYHLNAKK